MKAATALLKKSLIQQHRLASTVREVPPRDHAENNRVDVSSQSELGPIGIVRVPGARIAAIPFMSSRLMNKLIPVCSEGAIDRDLVEEGQQNLVDYFQKKGYFDAQVKTDFQRQPDRISLVYEIDRGKKHRVDSIAFHGNRQIPEKELLAQVVVKKSHIWNHGSISQKLLKQSKDNLQALYRDRGYEEVKVSPKVVNRELKLAVTFEIDEGQQTLVDNVQVTGNNRVPYVELAAPKGIQLQRGAPFSPRRLIENPHLLSPNSC